MARRIVTAFLISGILSVAATGQDERRIRDKLASTTIPQIDFDDVTLIEFARQISQLSGENVVVIGIEESRMPMVSIKLKGVSLESLLNLVLGPEDLIHAVEGSVIYIKKKSTQPVVLELYDVNDLTAPLRDFPGVDVILDSNSLGVSTATPEGAELPGLTADALVEMIQAHTGGKSWDELPGASVSATAGGLIVVRQTKETQRRIARFLSQMRRLR